MSRAPTGRPTARSRPAQEFGATRRPRHGVLGGMTRRRVGAGGAYGARAFGTASRHRVTRDSRRTFGPVLAVTGKPRNLGQPAFPPTGPYLIGRAQQIGPVECAQMHLHLVPRNREDRRSANGAEMPPVIGPCVAVDADLTGPIDRGGVEHRPMVFAAVQAMAQTDPIGRPRHRDPNRAAHTQPPVRGAVGASVIRRTPRAARRAPYGRARH